MIKYDEKKKHFNQFVSEMFDSLQFDSTRCALQDGLNSFVTMATYSVPYLPDIKGFSGHLWHSIFIFANGASSAGSSKHIYRILHGKCARTVFTHELWRIRNRTSERSERVRFLIQNNECVNTVQSTFHVVLCLLYTYWDWTPSLNCDKLYLNKCGQTTITERKQLRKKRKSSNKIQNLWNKVGLSEFSSIFTSDRANKFC